MAGVIDLTHEEHDRLRRLVRAGAAGLPLNGDLPVSTAIRLEMAGMATIRTEQGRLRAAATSRAEAFLHRTVR